jgi:hypothetical protein
MVCHGILTYITCNIMGYNIRHVSAEKFFHKFGGRMIVLNRTYLQVMPVVILHMWAVLLAKLNSLATLIRMSSD